MNHFPFSVNLSLSLWLPAFGRGKVEENEMIPNVKEKIASGTPIGLAVTPEVNTHCRMKVMSWKTLIIS